MRRRGEKKGGRREAMHFTAFHDIHDTFVRFLFIYHWRLEAGYLVTACG